MSEFQQRQFLPNIMFVELNRNKARDIIINLWKF